MWSFVSTWYFSVQAAEAAKSVLENGGDAMDAVVLGINKVESDPTVESVGKGGFLNENGELALDAAVMDGNTLQTGAVLAVRGFENPVNIARAVMEHTKHNILAESGAEEFARKMGIKQIDMEELITDHAREMLKKSEEIGHDTIGAIALDESGKLAVGTSTSGANMKLRGRVGDSPIIGSGFYAESGVGAAAATGLGEDIMRTCCSFRCVEFMRAGMSPKDAVEKTVRLAHEAIIAHGGKPDNIAMVCMNDLGEYAAAANHEGFTYAFAKEGVAPQMAKIEPIAYNK